MNSQESEVEKWVKQAFDPSAEKRLEATKNLSNFATQPIALYTLIELTHDKDLRVRQLAREIIDMQKDSYLSDTVKKLDENLFEALKKSHAKEKEIKQKLEMVEDALIQQEDLSKALEVLKDISATELMKEPSSSNLREVRKESEEKITDLLEGIKTLDDLTEDEIVKIENFTTSIEKTELYRYALSFVSGAKATKKQINDEIKRLVDAYKRKVRLAFDLAWYKQMQMERVYKIAQLKPGLKKVDIENLEVVRIEELPIRKGKKLIYFAGIHVKDETGSCLVVVEQTRAHGIKVNDMVEVEKATVESFEGSLRIVLGKGSHLIIKR